MKQRRKRKRFGDKEAFVFNFDHDIHAPMPPTPPGPPHGHKKIFKFRTGEPSGSHIYQSVEDDVLELLISMPGIDKTTLKVRSKTDKISISADMKEEYVGKLGDESVNYVFNLVEEVDADQAKAKYKDGILQINIPILNPGTEVNLEE